MRIMTYISTVFILLTVALGCIHNQKTSEVKSGVDNPEMLAMKIIGEYAGNLPCVDCEAISTLLEINRDNSYVLTYTYEGKSDDTFVKEGFWKINKNKLVLNGVDYRYKISDDKLYQLDLSGNEITGELALNYQLSKVK